MKKLLFLIMSMAFVFTACEDKDVTLTKGIVGTWVGTTMVDEDETDMICQFFADENATTGKYVEALTYFDEVEEYGITYALPYNVYVGGKFRVKDASVKITYDTTSVEVSADTTAIRDYIMSVLEYDREQGEQRYVDQDVEELIRNYTKGTNAELSELWTEIYKESNNDSGYGFSDLQVDEKTMSYKSSDLGKIEFTRSPQNLYEEYPLED